MANAIKWHVQKVEDEAKRVWLRVELEVGTVKADVKALIQDGTHWLDTQEQSMKTLIEWAKREGHI